MNITFKLFATLTDYLPAEARRSNQVTLEVAQDASISQIIEPFGMPPRLVHLVLVPGKLMAPEDGGQATRVAGGAPAACGCGSVPVHVPGADGPCDHWRWRSGIALAGHAAPRDCTHAHAGVAGEFRV